MENQTASMESGDNITKSHNNDVDIAEQTQSQSESDIQSRNVVAQATFHHHHHHQAAVGSGSASIIQSGTATAASVQIVTSPQQPNNAVGMNVNVNSINEFHHHHIHHGDVKLMGGNSNEHSKEKFKGRQRKIEEASRKKSSELRHRRGVHKHKKQHSNSSDSHSVSSGSGESGAITPPTLNDSGKSRGMVTKNAERWTKLENLKMLYDEGFISKEEYVGRRSQIIDDMTGTNHSALLGTSTSSVLSSSQYGGSRIRRRSSRVLNPYVMPRPPPSDFTVFQPEKAIRHFFDLQKRVWTQEQVMVRMDDTPFARGGLRLVYHLQAVKDDEAMKLMNSMDYNSMYNDFLNENVHSWGGMPYRAGDNMGITPGQKLSQLIEEEEDEEGCINSNTIEEQSNKCPMDKTCNTETANHDNFDKESQNGVAADDESINLGLGLVDNVHSSSESSDTNVTDSILRDIVLKNVSNAKSYDDSALASMELKKDVSYVAKLAIDPYEDPGTYFRDVEMQAHCAYYARLFNSYDPPRPVEFCKAWILELIERDNSPICGVEKFIKGSGSKYRKHNNNFGYVSDDERNTPQAFSHFTYEASAHTMLVVDIQGVGDMYTDPQIHTIRGTDFGKGNLGMRGIQRFLETHRCNSICRYLKLPAVNPKGDTVDSTMPVKPLMPHARINRQQFAEGHYYENSPYLQKMLQSRSVISQVSTAQSSVYVTNSMIRQRRAQRYGRKDSEQTYWDISDDIEGCFAHCPSCSIL